ncbi:putative thiamine transporter SLC35F3 [Channa argus]|uniref:Putative thiamine transporter SLC35F3 n=1 Tax=Channa argus TaxID=215402 RepID=A0A6G1R165_CHAAH|nr:putative thiamine transporter SLC35F3 [Channa argus]
MDVFRCRIAATVKTVREERPSRTHSTEQIWGGKASRREGVGGYDRARGGKKSATQELDGCEGTESRTLALETSRVPSSGLVSAPNQLQGCSRSGLELSPSELIIMKKHSARVAPLSACNSPVLTLTKVEASLFVVDLLALCDSPSDLQEHSEDMSC